MLFPSTVPLRTFLHPYPLNLVFSPYKKLNKTKQSNKNKEIYKRTNQNPIRQKMSKKKKTQTKQKFTQHTWNVFCDGQLYLGIGPCLGMWLVYPVSLHWRKQILPCFAGSYQWQLASWG